MENEKLITGRVSVDKPDLHEGVADIMNPDKDFHFVTKDEGQVRPIIIGRIPGLGRMELLHSRLNWGERAVIAIPVERNRNGSHNIALNLDFDLPLAKVEYTQNKETGE